MRAPLALALALLAACGGKTDLKVGPPVPDGGPPLPPITVDCGRSLQYTTPRLPITLTAEVVAEAGVATQGWELLASPPMSGAAIAPTDGPTTTLRQNGLGNYNLRFTATDTMARSASCNVTVESIIGPPRALCPEGELRTTAGVPLVVEGDGFDDIDVVSFRWEVVSAPGPADVRPANVAVTNFTATATGDYVLRLTVTDGDGASHSCETLVRVVGAPMLFCPPVVEAPTRQPVTIEVTATDDTRVRRGTFELIAQPPRSRAEITDQGRDGDAFRVTFTPDRQGEYVLRFTARDEDGLESSCEILVIGLPTPPTALCEDVRTVPLTNTNVGGAAEDDGEIVRWEWSLVSGPPGSDARPPSPRDARDTVFFPDLAGEYLLELTITDDDGMMDSCVTTVRAEATEGLRVEMFWNSDGTDMDTHLLNPDASSWFNGDDCYYANCVGGNGWGASLDIDDVDGFGPENINMETPSPGTYRVGVHAFRGRAGQVNVRIYCGGSTTEPRATFGPVPMSDEDFWRVADVEIRRDGTCRVEGINEVSTRGDAERRR